MSLIRDGESEVLHAVGLLEHRSEFLLKSDGRQASTELLKVNLQVLIVEELGVVQAGANNTLVAVDDRLADARIGIGHDDEGARELAICVIRGEIALIGEHGLADDLGGHGEELLVKVTNQDCGPFAQIHDLIEDLRGRVDVDAELLLNLGDAVADDLLAAIGGQHMGRLEHLFICARGRNHVLTRRQHAVASGGAGARDVSERDGNDLIAEQAADPANGAHEGGVLATPALAAVVGPLDSGDDLLAYLGKNGRSVLGRRVLLGEHVLGAVGVLAADKL